MSVCDRHHSEREGLLPSQPQPYPSLMHPIQPMRILQSTTVRTTMTPNKSSLAHPLPPQAPSNELTQHNPYNQHTNGNPYSRRSPCLVFHVSMKELVRVAEETYSYSSYRYPRNYCMNGNRCRNYKMSSCGRMCNLWVVMNGYV
jgi:hypothetical protein